MFYLDTSLLVSILTLERNSDVALEWFSKLRSASLCISDWLITEFSAALSRKTRTKELPDALRTDSLDAFNRLREAQLTTLRVHPRHFEAAARLADRHGTGLRAGDALHLAIAADHGCTLCTLDRRLHAAGVALGLGSMLVGGRA